MRIASKTDFNQRGIIDIFRKAGASVVFADDVGKGKIKLCQYCNNPFYCRPSHYDKKTYCSKKCMAEDYKIRLKGKNNPHYSNADAKICAQCKKSFKSYKKTRKYCSQKCYQISGVPQKWNNIQKKNIKYGKCKNCGGKVLRRAYCEQCWNKKNLGKNYPCKNCGKISKRKRNYCRKCRKLFQKYVIPVSVCFNCGIQFQEINRKYCNNCWREIMKTPRMTNRRIDQNQPEIISALKIAGCSVLDLSAVGGGCPDIAVCRNGETFLFEIKNKKTRGKLNRRQELWHQSWKGQVAVIFSAEEAIQYMNKWIEKNRRLSVVV